MATEVLGDDRALRTGRRERALAQMEAHDLDVLVLGRQSNIRYVSGAQQLWVAGTRPFAPSCVLLRNGAVHLLSTWDEGVPEDIPHENLYGIAWNPVNTIENLKKIPGAASARRVGSDALSPGFAQLLPMAFPNAELVDGEAAMGAARRIKTPEEIDALRESVRVAEVGLAAATAKLQSGASLRDLTAVLLEAMTAGGVSSPAHQDAVWVTAKDHPWRRVRGDERVHDGDLVAFSSAVLDRGYIGEVGRTLPVGAVGAGTSALYKRSDRLHAALIDACRPGAANAGLLAAYEAAGEPLPVVPVAHGLGVGFDSPVVSPQLAATAAREKLEPGMVLAVTGYVFESGVGAVFRRDSVVITADGCEVLTSSPADG
ncbi:M24 family metallopeptidase [Mycobacterium sp. RTGN5]|uniref:M24 family metallopeptidase n=1 Tax=Mycobacterium sp. RTGN5 TaxID=3016522 RepID=UPI0029C75C0C|nr:M24 family metallopeptidase [Mycobacterium sp. RTGN5]